MEKFNIFYWNIKSEVDSLNNFSKKMSSLNFLLFLLTFIVLHVSHSWSMVFHPARRAAAAQALRRSTAPSDTSPPFPRPSLKPQRGSTWGKTQPGVRSKQEASSHYGGWKLSPWSGCYKEQSGIKMFSLDNNQALTETVVFLRHFIFVLERWRQVLCGPKWNLRKDSLN